MSRIFLSTVAANAAADAVAKLLDGGYMAIYEGAQPSSYDKPLPAGTKLLATLQFGTPAFRPSTGGAAQANPMQPDKDASDTGRPQWFRLFKADNRTAVYDGDISTGTDAAARQRNAAMHMRALVIGKHAEVTIDSCVIRMPQSEAA